MKIEEKARLPRDIWKQFGNNKGVGKLISTPNFCNECRQTFLIDSQIWVPYRQKNLVHFACIT